MRAETLRFKKEGVYCVVSTVMLVVSCSSLLWECSRSCRFPGASSFYDFSYHCFIYSSNQVKDVFLPWYNAYRFLVQNAKRLELEGADPFTPIGQASLQKSSNVLDQWIYSATQSLVHFVQKEMDAYRLYTVSGSTIA